MNYSDAWLMPSASDSADGAIRSKVTFEDFFGSRLSGELVDYPQVVDQKRLLPSLDHRDPARCVVTLTGLTHLESTKYRDDMYSATSPESLTDSVRMFQIGLKVRKPKAGGIGAQPEWAYKGDGRWIVPPEHQEGDVFEVDVPMFGRPLRNPLRIEKHQRFVRVKSL